MAASATRKTRWLFPVLAAMTAGCTGLPDSVDSQRVRQDSQALWTAKSPAPIDSSRVVPASFQAPPNDPSSNDPPLAKANTLSVDLLVEQVLARNPTLEQMIAAQQVAAARYPQVTALDDPMFTSVLSPASIGSNTVNLGGRLEVSQRIPYPGKRSLRGASATAETSAAGHDVADTRLQLVEAARLAFFDLYLLERSIAVNEDGLKLMKELHANAQSRFKNNLAPEQEVDQAELDVGRQQERAATLARMRKVSIARINTLLNRPPESPLPSPPEKLSVGDSFLPLDVLRTSALSQRPDLLALQDRLAAEQTALASAYREYYPDFEAMAAYDSIMGNGPMRQLAGQVGLRMNIPVRLERRQAAVAEAQGRVAQRRAEVTSRMNQISFEVQEAYEKLLESEKVVGLYEKTLIPAADKTQKAEDAAYRAGKTPFFRIIEAKRTLIELRGRQHEAMADYLRRRATLERAVGGPLNTPIEQPKAKP